MLIFPKPPSVGWTQSFELACSSLRVSFGGVPPEDQPFAPEYGPLDMSLFCLVLFDSSISNTRGELIGLRKSMLPGGGLRMLPTRGSYDEWSEHFLIRFDKLDKSVKSIVFGYLINPNSEYPNQSLSPLTDLFMRFVDAATDKVIGTSQVPGWFTAEKALVFGELHRGDNSAWHYRFKGDAYNSFADIKSCYRI